MKTNLDQLYRTDGDIEKEGVLIRFTDKVAFKVRRYGGTNNTEFKKASKKYFKPHAKQIERGAIDPNLARELVIKSFVEGCLVDWEGVEIDGEVKDYDPKLAIDLFKELPDLFDELLDQSQNVSNFREEEEGTEDLGNS